VLNESLFAITGHPTAFVELPGVQHGLILLF